MIVNVNTKCKEYSIPAFKGYNMNVAIAAIMKNPNVTIVNGVCERPTKEFPIHIWWDAGKDTTYIQLGIFEEEFEEAVTLRINYEMCHHIMDLLSTVCP